MATHFQVRIACDDKTYAAQAAQAAFDLLDSLESHLSRFRSDSDICSDRQIWLPAKPCVLSEPAFACLQIAKRMDGHAQRISARRRRPENSTLPSAVEFAPGRAFNSLRERPACNSIWAPSAKDSRSTAWPNLLRDWDCPSFLLVAGGSSILAGDQPAG